MLPTYQNQSQKLEFGKNNAPKIVAGIESMEKFFINLRKNSLESSQIIIKSISHPN